MKIGILGGSFDPIHNGHLLLAEQVRDHYDLDLVYFIPAKIPPHKQDKKLIPSEDRYHMVELAIANNPHFHISDLELKRTGVSYTIDTIHTLRSHYGPDTQIYFISGADTIFILNTWMTIEALLKEVIFVGAVRPGYDTSALKEAARALNDRYGGDVRVVEIAEVEISSTDIRNRIYHGKSVRYLLPDPVITYIMEKGFYLEK